MICFAYNECTYIYVPWHQMQTDSMCNWIGHCILRTWSIPNLNRISLIFYSNFCANFAGIRKFMFLRFSQFFCEFLFHRNDLKRFPGIFVSNENTELRIIPEIQKLATVNVTSLLLRKLWNRIIFVQWEKKSDLQKNE